VLEDDFVTLRLHYHLSSLAKSIMFGAEFTEVIGFMKQVGLVLAGAAALWGIVFEIKCKHENQQQKCIAFEWIAERLLTPLFVGVALSALIDYYF